MAEQPYNVLDDDAAFRLEKAMLAIDAARSGESDAVESEQQPTATIAEQVPSQYDADDFEGMSVSEHMTALAAQARENLDLAFEPAAPAEAPPVIPEGSPDDYDLAA